MLMVQTYLHILSRVDTATSHGMQCLNKVAVNIGLNNFSMSLLPVSLNLGVRIDFLD